MRALVLVLAVAVSICGSVACTSGRHALRSDDAPHGDAQQLIRLDDEWSRAAGKKDVDLVASFYAEDAIAYPPNEPVAVGRAAAKKVWAAYFAEPTFAISWKPDHASISASGELGFTSGNYEASYKGSDGTTVREVGKFLCVWAKQKDGTWKAIHDMWNTDAK